MRNMSRKPMIPGKTLTLENGKTVEEPRSKVIPITIVFLIAVYFAGRVTGFNLNTIMTRGYQFFVIIGRMFPPNIEYINQVWEPLFDTVKMSLLGSLVGSVLVIPFAIIASSNIIKNRWVISITRLFLSIVRTLPTLVTALVATYVFGLGTIAGTFAITVFTFSYVGKQLYEQIETVDMGAFEAAEALGATKGQAFANAIIPQVLPAYLSTCLYCFEGNVRYAAILGYVGAGGIGLILNENIGWREYSNVGMILVVLFFTVVVIESISYYLRTKLT